MPFPKKPYTKSRGDPQKSPFEDNLAYRLAVELEFSNNGEMEFADFEVVEEEHHSLQQQFWMFNSSQQHLDWKFATRHFPSPGGLHDVIRVWKVPNKPTA